MRETSFERVLPHLGVFATGQTAAGHVPGPREPLRIPQHPDRLCPRNCNRETDPPGVISMLWVERKQTERSGPCPPSIKARPLRRCTAVLAGWWWGLMVLCTCVVHVVHACSRFMTWTAWQCLPTRSDELSASAVIRWCAMPAIARSTLRSISRRYLHMARTRAGLSVCRRIAKGPPRPRARESLLLYVTGRDRSMFLPGRFTYREFSSPVSGYCRGNAAHVPALDPSTVPRGSMSASKTPTTKRIPGRGFGKN